jgi:hypothetical protein
MAHLNNGATTSIEEQTFIEVTINAFMQEALACVSKNNNDNDICG